MRSAVASASFSPAKTKASDLRQCSRLLRTVVEREGLSHHDVSQLAGATDLHQKAAVDFLFGHVALASRRAVCEVIERLEDKLGVELGSNKLVSPTRRVGKLVADAIGGFLAFVCSYIVIGGLIEGDSLLLGQSIGAWGLALFGVILCILGLFEALHTSVTMLKIADLGALAANHPRAAALHRHFRSDLGLARFLAGRQEVVILTVFLCSPLSSFPDLTHWPLSGIPLPQMIRPFVIIGIPGALFVLWFGQLVPQFVATRHAVSLTDARIVSLAFRVAYALEGMGFARLGFWCVAWDRSTAQIPSSPALRWKQAAEELDGFGGVGLVREWMVSDALTELHSSSVVRIYNDRTSSITDGSQLVPGTPARLTLDALAAREDGEPLALAVTEHREERLPTGDRRFHKPIVSAVGSFHRGDALQVILDASYEVDPSRDLVHVDRPVRFVLFRVILDGPPRIMSAATLSIYTVGDGLGDLTAVGHPQRIEPREGPSGYPMIQHVLHFPAPNTLISLDWEVELDV